MKKLLFGLSLLPLFFTACDVVPVDEVYETKNNIPNDTSRIDTTNKLVFKKIKTVVLEDFTGHTCSNCPKAAKDAKTLSQLYGDSLILMAWHVGFFAIPKTGTGSFETDFRTPEGEELNRQYRIDFAGLPKGMVNRKKHNNLLLMNSTAWSEAVASAYQNRPLIYIHIDKAQLTGNILEIKALFLPWENISTTLQAYAFVLEDSVIENQLDKADNGQAITIENYQFDHIVRSQLQPNDGPTFPENLVASDTLKKTFTSEWKTEWKVLRQKKCEIVVVIYDQTSGEILQAAKRKLLVN